MEQPTSVYLYYDADGVLIYTGITSRGGARQSEHVKTKAWWPYVHRQEVEHFASRAEAQARERRLIRDYCPPYNVQHNPGHESVRALYEANLCNGANPIDPARRAHIYLSLLTREGSALVVATPPHWARVAVTLAGPRRWRGARAVAGTVRCGQVTGLRIQGPVAVLTLDVRSTVEVLDPVLLTKVEMTKSGPIHSIRSLRIAPALVEK